MPPKSPILFLYFLLAFSLSTFAAGNKHKAQKVQLKGFHNLYKLNDSIYRSEQPDKSGMIELQQRGIITVLNLRDWHTDRFEAKATSLILAAVPIQTSKIAYADILKSLAVIQHARKPILIHCWHGSDRTGCIVAAYRMVFENWTKEEAISELKEKDYGYHATMFPNILTLLNSLDVAALQRDLGINVKY